MEPFIPSNTTSSVGEQRLVRDDNDRDSDDEEVSTNKHSYTSNALLPLVPPREADAENNEVSTSSASSMTRLDAAPPLRSVSSGRASLEEPNTIYDNSTTTPAESSFYEKNDPPTQSTCSSFLASPLPLDQEAPAEEDEDDDDDDDQTTELDLLSSFDNNGSCSSSDKDEKEEAAAAVAEQEVVFQYPMVEEEDEEDKVSSGSSFRQHHHHPPHDDDDNVVEEATCVFVPPPPPSDNCSISFTPAIIFHNNHRHQIDNHVDEDDDDDDDNGDDDDSNHGNDRYNLLVTPTIGRLPTIDEDEVVVPRLSPLPQEKADAEEEVVVERSAPMEVEDASTFYGVDSDRQDEEEPTTATFSKGDSIVASFSTENDEEVATTAPSVVPSFATENDEETRNMEHPMTYSPFEPKAMVVDSSHFAQEKDPHDRHKNEKEENKAETAATGEAVAVVGLEQDRGEQNKKAIKTPTTGTSKRSLDELIVEDAPMSNKDNKGMFSSSSSSFSSSSSSSSVSSSAVALTLPLFGHSSLSGQLVPMEPSAPATSKKAPPQSVVAAIKNRRLYKQRQPKQPPSYSLAANQTSSVQHPDGGGDAVVVKKGVEETTKNDNPPLPSAQPPLPSAAASNGTASVATEKQQMRPNTETAAPGAVACVGSLNDKRKNQETSSSEEARSSNSHLTVKQRIGPNTKTREPGAVAFSSGNNSGKDDDTKIKNSSLKTHPPQLMVETESAADQLAKRRAGANSGATHPGVVASSSLLNQVPPMSPGRNVAASNSESLLLKTSPGGSVATSNSSHDHPTTLRGAAAATNASSPPRRDVPESAATQLAKRRAGFNSGTTVPGVVASSGPSSPSNSTVVTAASSTSRKEMQKLSEAVESTRAFDFSSSSSSSANLRRNSSHVAAATVAGAPAPAAPTSFSASAASAAAPSPPSAAPPTIAGDSAASQLAKRRAGPNSGTTKPGAVAAGVSLPPGDETLSSSTSRRHSTATSSHSESPSDRTDDLLAAKQRVGPNSGPRQPGSVASLMSADSSSRGVHSAASTTASPRHRVPVAVGGKQVAKHRASTGTMPRGSGHQVDDRSSNNGNESIRSIPDHGLVGISSVTAGSFVKQRWQPNSMASMVSSISNDDSLRSISDDHHHRQGVETSPTSPADRFLKKPHQPNVVMIRPDSSLASIKGSNDNTCSMEEERHPHNESTRGLSDNSAVKKRFKYARTRPDSVTSFGSPKNGNDQGNRFFDEHGRVKECTDDDEFAKQRVGPKSGSVRPGSVAFFRNSDSSYISDISSRSFVPQLSEQRVGPDSDKLPAGSAKNNGADDFNISMEHNRGGELLESDRCAKQRAVPKTGTMTPGSVSSSGARSDSGNYSRSRSIVEHRLQEAAPGQCAEGRRESKSKLIRRPRSMNPSSEVGKSAHSVTSNLLPGGLPDDDDLKPRTISKKQLSLSNRTGRMSSGTDNSENIETVRHGERFSANVGTATTAESQSPIDYRNRSTKKHLGTIAVQQSHISPPTFEDTNERAGAVRNTASTEILVGNERAGKAEIWRHGTKPFGNENTSAGADKTNFASARVGVFLVGVSSASITSSQSYDSAHVLAGHDTGAVKASKISASDELEYSVASAKCKGAYQRRRNADEQREQQTADCKYKEDKREDVDNPFVEEVSQTTWDDRSDGSLTWLEEGTTSSSAGEERKLRKPEFVISELNKKDENIDGLVVAVAVDSEEEDNDLVKAEDYASSADHSVHIRPWYKEIFAWFAIALACSVVAGTAFGLAKSSGSDDNVAAVVSTGPPTPSPSETASTSTAPTTSDEQYLRDWLHRQNISQATIDLAPVAFDMAIDWYTYEDRSRDLSIVGSEYPWHYERFILTWFYFISSSNGTKPWVSCNPPKYAAGQSDHCVYYEWTNTSADRSYVNFTHRPGTPRWLSKYNHCDWPGVSCMNVSDLDPDDALFHCDGAVNGLELIAFGLTGSLPAVSNQLSCLETLRVSFNPRLTGTISPELFRFRSLLGQKMLKNFRLVNNTKMSGTIPAELWDLPNIEFIQLGDNGLVGTLPDFEGRLSHAHSLWLYGNSFEGSLPILHGDRGQAALTSLRLQRNCGGYTGSIPSEYGTLSSLRELWLFQNHLTGPIPEGLSDLPIEDLWLYNNLLSGSIPQHFVNLSYMKSFRVNNNHLTGELPDMYWENLRHLDIHTNQLEGELPTRLFNMTQLQYVALDKNSFRGTIDPRIGEHALGLTTFSVRDNNLSGSIPTALAKLENLAELFLDTNNFEGSLPMEICKNRGLDKLAVITADCLAYPPQNYCFCCTGCCDKAMNSCEVVSWAALNGSAYEDDPVLFRSFYDAWL
ncbi:hypothetical protein ACA910_013779 [Epithemia clementina (nom. ined.)]